MTPASATWRKASRSNSTGGNCVEASPTDRAVAIRDSKHTDGPTLSVTPLAWRAFTRRIR